jgi:hypothetical protein
MSARAEACISLVVVTCGLSWGCGLAPDEEDGWTPDGEIMDLDGAGTDPDPADGPDGAVQAAAALPTNCPSFGDHLSPDGLTLVFGVGSSQGAISAFDDMRKYIRNRDIFVASDGEVDELRQKFPCNRVTTLLGGSQRNDVGGHHSDGLALDVEPGFPGFVYSQSFVANQLHDFAHKVHGLPGPKQAGGAPIVNSITLPHWNYAQIHRDGNLDYMLAQVQPYCHSGLSSYSNVVGHLLGQYHPTDISVRDLAFEVSVGSGAGYPNGVDPGRAADCTKVIHSRGGRAVYFFGEASASRWKDILHALDNRGLRHPAN